ncbi:MAG: phytanoyl-CoA dioxygenase family protein [Chloroflexota bacterium]
MLKVEILNPSEIDRATTIFHRDGFVCVKNPLTADQFAEIKAASERVMQEQEDAFGRDNMNRGYARHSFGMQTHHWAWCMLIDLPTILPILDNIWQSDDYTCTGAGGDYSLPDARIQHLHSDLRRDFFQDPWGTCTLQDPPSPFIVVNFTMVDFTVENGAIRFVPGTHRSRAPIPSLDEEPDWMKTNHLCAPANTAIIRDVRCWHGGTANNADHKRPMTSAGYFAPWRRPQEDKVLPREHFERLSPRGQRLCRYIVEDA